MNLHLLQTKRPALASGLFYILLVALCFAAFGPTLNGEYIWDDEIWLTENAAVVHDNPSWIWVHYRSATQYYPLTVMSFWFEYRIWGFWAPGYRVINILLHAGSGLLLWQLLKRIKIPGAMLAAAIWVVHPIQVESVVWVTERKNTLSGIFFFAALLIWLRFIDPQLSRKSRIIAYCATGGLFILAMLAKTSVIFLPVALLGITWLMRSRLRIKDFVYTVPFFIFAGLMAWLTIFAERVLAAGGSFNDTFYLSFPQRFILSGRCFWFYVGKILWPDNLSVVYNRWPINAANPLEYLWPLSVIALFAAVILVAWRWRKPAPFIAAGIYLSAIFPVIGFLKFYTQIYTYVADHYVYLGCAIVIICVCSTLSVLWQWLRDHPHKFRQPAWLAPAGIGALIFSLTTLSFGQSATFRTFIGLWEETLRVTPTAWVAHANLAQAYAHQANGLQIALDHIRKGIALYRDPTMVYYYGALLEDTHQMQEARAAYEEAIAGGVRMPGAYLQLGNMEFNAGHIEKALELYKKGADYAGKEPNIWHNLGLCYQRTNQPALAAQSFQHAIVVDPKFAKSYVELGRMLIDAGETQQAHDCLQQAIKLTPSDYEAYRLLAIAQRKMGKEQDAQNTMNFALKLRDQQRAATQPK